MKLHKLIHLMALLALVACMPTAGPGAVTPIASGVTENVPTRDSVATIFAPLQVTLTALAVEVATGTPAPSPVAISATPSPMPPPAATLTPAPTDTATTAASPTSSQPQWGHRTKTAGCQVQGPFPDPACTPGDILVSVSAAQVCVPGYSSATRDVSQSEKDAVYAEYGITSHTTGEYEIDHFVSLEIGGSNDISNLFPEAANPTPGFHQKDLVENYLHEQVCSGAITLAQAQYEIATNWLAVYDTMLGSSAPVPTPGAAQPTATPPAVQGMATQAPQIGPTATPTAGGGDGARVRKGALCNDGTSSSATGSGACSGHGGVKCWNYSDGTCTKP